MSFVSGSVRTFRAQVRATLRRFLSQERRTELKRLQGQTRKRLGVVLTMAHGTFTTSDLIVELKQRLPGNFEILMVHSSFDTFLPMYKGNAKELVSGLIEFCGPNRTLVMPSFVMGGRTYDAAAYYQSRPFDVRTTPSDMGLIAEIFRRNPGVLRSLHPTVSLCAIGPLAKELTTGHHISETGMSEDSPFGVMTRRSTAILGLGVEYYRCLTHVHTAAHKMAEEFPIKFIKRTVPVTLIDYDGSRYVHHVGLPDRTKKLDLRVLWTILSPGELVEWRYHGVPMFVVPQARIITERLIEAAHRGITVYGKVEVQRESPASAMATSENGRL